MIQVTKGHAYGNDFLYVRTSVIDASRLDPVRLAVAMCGRHTGIGADGLILFSETTSGARMRLINSDGSPAEVSGNGVRALGALLARARGWSTPDPAPRTLVIDTEAGTKTLEFLESDGPGRYRFRADMGRPRDLRRVTCEVAGESIELIALDMGNPQAILLATLDEGRLARLGPALQHHPAFPAGVNFELAHVIDGHTLNILIWERGAGPTLSSGTGSCASAVAAMDAGLVERRVVVKAPGGTQFVDWTDAGVFLTGWAEVLFEGHWIGDAGAGVMLPAAPRGE